MNINTDRCLELAYEIEGLLLLSQNSEGKPLPAVARLLAQKSAELAELIKILEQAVAPVNTSASVDVETINPTPVDMENKPSVNNKHTETSATQPQAADIDAERIAETVEYEQREDSQPDAGSPDAYQTKLDEAQAEEDEADTEAAEMDNASRNYYGEIMQKRSDGTRLMQLFTLNDRYRFARELFGNSTTAFNVIIDEISTFTTAAEAIDYLRNRQGIDVNSAAGKDFVAIVSRFFS